MRPDEHDLDEEIRGHLAISISQRIERGEDPEAARLAALREFGYVPAMRESMRRVWYSRWFDELTALGQDIRVAFRSLKRAKGMAATVIVTLALGIGANAAIFSVVRGVLLRPLVNRDEATLDLHPPERAGPQRREHDVLGARDPGLQVARHDHQRVRRFLHRRLSDGRLRRAPPRAGRRGQRLVLRRDGPSARCSAD